MSILCPTCGHRLAPIPTATRPNPNPDHQLELITRVVLDGPAAGVTVRDAARAVFSVDVPTPAQVETVRRLLHRATEAQLLNCRNRPQGERSLSVFTIAQSTG